MLDALINQIDKVTFKVPHDWKGKMDKYYLPFVKAIWTNPDGLIEVCGRRKLVLYKYWALNNVTTLEEAQKLIPICPVCGKERCVSSVTEPKPEKGEWITSCHQKECSIKYTHLKHTKALSDKYGVTNPKQIK